MFVAIIFPGLLSYQGAVQLQFKPPVGATYKYKMKMDMVMHLTGGPSAANGKAMSPMTMSMSSNVDTKVLKRTGNVTTIETHVGSPSMTGTMAQMFGAMAGKNQQGQTLTSQLDNHFQLKSADGAASPFASAIGNMSFPSHPLRVGDTWTVSVDMAKVMGALGKGMAGMGSGKLPMKYAVEAIRHEGTSTIVVLHDTLDATPQIGTGKGASIDMHMTGGGTCSIDANTGMFTNFEMKMKIKGSAQGQGVSFNMDMTQSMTRV